MLQIGQKVMCVDASLNAEVAKHMPLWPKLNEVYTVASIHIDPRIDGYGVRLEELPNPSQVWSDGDDLEWSFDHRRFRPMVDQNLTAETALAAE